MNNNYIVDVLEKLMNKMDKFLINLTCDGSYDNIYTIMLLEIYCEKYYYVEILCHEIIRLNNIPKEIGTLIFNTTVQIIYDNYKKIHTPTYHFYRPSMIDNYNTFGKLLSQNKTIKYDKKINYVFWHNSCNREITHY